MILIVPAGRDAIWRSTHRDAKKFIVVWQTPGAAKMLFVRPVTDAMRVFADPVWIVTVNVSSLKATQTIVDNAIIEWNPDKVV